jgi:sterol desaturase/sphingolipid hydroxylase (fatty acid hydroxylase superfamily)
MKASSLEKPVSYLLFPLLFGGSMLVWGLMWKRYGWHPGLALQIVYWGFFFVLFALERFYPFERAWNQHDGQVRNDIVMSLLTIGVNSLATIAFVWGFLWLVATVQPLVSLRIWPEHWPLYVSLIPGIILWDLGNHLAHRWAHKVPLLWRFHSVHHSAPRICVINTGRFHPIDIIKSVMIGAPIPMLIGVPPEVGEWYAAAYVLVGILTHTNVKMRCGVFNYFLNTPELHRWHHSPVQVETDTNFGEFTVVWDHVFRTYRFPKRAPRRNVGLEGTVPVSRRLLHAFYHPLTRAGHRASPADGIRCLAPGDAGIEPPAVPAEGRTQSLASAT